VLERRKFLKALGVTGSAAILDQCAPTPPHELIPYLVSPDSVTPGVGAFYATTCRECPAGCGMIVKAMNGRVTKAEGNPQHPISRGHLCARGQASVQGVYNPDRFRTPMARAADQQLQPISWPDAETMLASRLRAAKARGADRIAWIGGLQTGSMDRLISTWLTALGTRRRLYYETFDCAALAIAGDRAFGRRETPRYDFARADYIVSFGAEFLETWISNVEFANDYAQTRRRRIRDVDGVFTCIAPRLSLTGLNADGWIAPRPGTETLIALALAHVIVAEGLSHRSAAPYLPHIASLVARYAPEPVAAAAGIDADAIRRVARRLATATPSLVIGGGTAGAGDDAIELEIAALMINVLAGNIGETVIYGADHAIDRIASRDDVDRMVRAMAAGEIDVLVIHHANPVGTLPPAVGFADALAHVPFLVSFASRPDETTDRANIVMPDHHFLESWGDYTPRTGVAGLEQPAALPLFDTRATGDVLIDVANQIDVDTARAVDRPSWAERVRSSWDAGAMDQEGAASWAEALGAGGRFESFTPIAPAFRDVSDAFARTTLPESPPAAADWTFIAYPSTRFYDGRNANEPWLQEVPDPVTSIVWNGWIEIHPAAARRLGVVEGDAIRVTSPHGRAEAPAHLYAGMREDVIAMPMGYGRSQSAHYAGGRGQNAVMLLPARAADAAHGVWRTGHVDVQRGGSRRRVIALRPVHADTDGAGPPPLGKIVNPARVDERDSDAPHPVDLYQPHHHTEHRWGMAIDLNSCIGCNACVVACYAENNVPVVGEQFCAQGRDMSWIRIERHDHPLPPAGSLRRPGAVFLPMLCQHCDEAPCESVCPVYATYHNPEGLNAQVYARCIGTRFCSNNCPYKVRRFNWARFGWTAPLGEQLNPDVTVRSVGVMEKCTFCVQRIQAAKLDAKRGARALRDGDVTPACAQTCPADAIVFGDLHDPQSRVSRLAEAARGYHVLAELNTRPAITYLRRSMPGAPRDER
jgi:anaerobic selenocysteine-containing dehydrogenase/Fe-S-cluster-containing dehydrogenase component